MLLISYYLERGFNTDRLCTLSPAEKSFYTASAMYWLERENKKQEMILALIQALAGVKYG